MSARADMEAFCRKVAEAKEKCRAALAELRTHMAYKPNETMVAAVFECVDDFASPELDVWEMYVNDEDRRAEMREMVR